MVDKLPDLVAVVEEDKSVFPGTNLRCCRPQILGLAFFETAAAVAFPESLVPFFLFLVLVEAVAAVVYREGDIVVVLEWE